MISRATAPWQGMPDMQRLTSLSALDAFIVSAKSQGKTIGFAPTMGALHDGHLSLMNLARKNADVVVASIYVNPAQFAPHEDFDQYPRQMENDCAMLENIGVDAVYLPSKADIYPQGIDEHFSVGEIGQILEGQPRPHFFNGVGQVVLRLFEQVQPNVAVFGEKDFQQLTIIRKLVKEHNLPINIIGAPIIREADGLAMSSRNVYLLPEHRVIAPALYRVLKETAEAVREGKTAEEAGEQATQSLLNSGLDSVDYVELRDAVTLGKWGGDITHGRLLAAARLGSTRLIDNIAL